MQQMNQTIYNKLVRNQDDINIIILRLLSMRPFVDIGKCIKVEDILKNANIEIENNKTTINHNDYNITI
jgi:hypothetical protein